MKRRMFVATTASFGTTLLAGCSSGEGSGSTTDESGDTSSTDGGEGSGSTDDGSGDSSTDSDGTGIGVFRLLISDQPAAIEDFDSLDVTLSSARIFRAGGDEEVTPLTENGTVTQSPESSPTNTTTDETEDDEDDDGENAGFVEFDLDSVTVDLTQVVGDRAVSVLENELDEGQYSGIELRVASAEGVVDGEAVDVMVPSNRLRIIKPFEIGADAELSFVFDIEVVQKGPNGSYNLLPVIGKSGVTGTDVEVEEIDTEDDDTTETPNDTDRADEDGGNDN